MADDDTRSGDKNAAGRGLKAEERRLWEHAMRDARPLRPNAVASGGPDARSPFMQKLQKKAASAGPQSVVPMAAGGELRPQLANRPLAALDRRTSQKLRSGRIPIDATLDLHGLRQAEAHRRLIGFIDGCRRQRMKCVLVITGKGMAAGEDRPWGAEPARGVLRTTLPSWLQVPPLNHAVIKYQAAHVRHGGTGAFYLFLRKPESL